MSNSYSSNYVCCHLSFYLMLLLISSLTQVSFMAEGRSVSRFLQVLEQTGNEDVRTSMIGSRPPWCERRCTSCPQCEAIQVPVSVTARHFSISYSKGDDISNYKPMSWKCKCGDFIFNP